MSDLRRFGDYEFPRAPVSLLYARLEFIRAISEKFPRAIEELHDMPLIAYRESGLLAMHTVNRHHFWTQYIAGWRDDYFLGLSLIYRIEPLPEWGPDLLERTIWMGGGSDPLPKHLTEHLPKLIAMRDSLIAWAKTYNLEKAGWMLHWAYLKLDAYADTDESSGHVKTYRYAGLPDAFGREFQPPENPYSHNSSERGPGNAYTTGITSFAIRAGFLNAAKFEPFALTLRGWEMTIESRARYEKMARETFEREIKAYLDTQESRPDLIRSEWKREQQHFKWLACYQCDSERKSKATIASELRVPRTAFANAIERVAKLIGLTLRADSRGRPRGRTDRKKRQRRN